MSRTKTAIVIVMLAHVLAGCDRSRSSLPSAPSQVPQGTPQPTPAPTLSVFTESVSGFSTTDVRDADDQIVQFNSAGELIWTADGTHLSGFAAQGIYIPADRQCGCWLEVRFGTKDGERRAYLTADYGHDNPGTLVDLELAAGVLVVSRTNVFPPGTYTMSGVITELTPTGQIPLEGVGIYRSYGSGWQGAETDRNGFYLISGLYDGTSEVSVGKEGYQSVQRSVPISGDTRFDIQLVRR